jgi:hypothetical protein
MLLNPTTDENPFASKSHGFSAPTVAYSGNSDGNGQAAFTGVAAGVYDIRVINPSGGSVYSYGYQVRNYYLVDPANVEESRFAARSGEHVLGISAGIIARRADNPMGTMSSDFQWSRQTVSSGGINVGQEVAAPIIQGTGTGQNQWSDSNNGNTFVTALPLEGKISGLSFYHDNQYLVAFQKMDIVIQ